MKRDITRNLLLALTLAASPMALTPAYAQDETTPAPATEQTQNPTTDDQPQKMQATIRAVKGIVQYRVAEDQAWQKVEVEQVLDVGVEFRTGPRSSVTFHVPPDQLITLDRLGTLKLLDAINNDSATVATTELGMTYGRARYQVEGAQGVEHHATIRSPSATLAIRGTQDVTFTDQRPGPASASSKGTRVYFRPKSSPVQVVFGSNEDSSSQTLEEGDSSPGETRNRQRVVDAGPRGARSEAEFQIINDFELYNGAQINNGIRDIRTQNVPITTDPGEGCGDYVEVGAGGPNQN